MSEPVALAGERCSACRPGSPMVTPDEEATLLPHLPEWEIVEVNGTRRLKRVFRFSTWMAAVDFAHAIGVRAEAVDHHPTILVAWGKVTVTWWTHAIGGLHRNDFIMAAQSDQAFAQV